MGQAILRQSDNSLKVETEGDKIMSITDYDGDWTSPIGGKWEYWTRNQKMIGEFIRTHEIRVAEIGMISAAAPVAKAAPAAKAHIDLGIRGGMRVPHLHFDNKIYVLNSDQWAKFSEHIVADCKAKLANVKEVPFEAGILLGSAIQAMGRG
jgi:hypothetical protein